MTKETLRSTADALVAHCNNHTEAEGLKTLYAPDAESVEAVAMDGGDRVAKGVDAIKAKHDWWNGNMEMHSGSISGPYLHGDDRFAVIFEMDATDKNSKKRFQMKEIGVYTVNDAGKIVREEFFYTM